MMFAILLFVAQENLSNDGEKNVAKNEVVEKSPTKAVMLSLVFPGGGQFYTHRYIKGIIIGGIEIFLGYMGYMENSIAVEEGSSSHIEKRNQYLWYLGGVIVYSMADAYISAHFYDFKEEEKIEEELGEKNDSK